MELLKCIRTLELPSGKKFYAGYAYQGLYHYTPPGKGAIPIEGLVVIYDYDKTWLINGSNHFEQTGIKI